MFVYGWEASMGPSLSMMQGPHNVRIAKMMSAARATYSDDMDARLDAVAKAFEEEARPFYTQLLEDEQGARLASLPLKSLSVACTHRRARSLRSRVTCKSDRFV